jgi:eukaryotic-like serine/threonine-protein kinase
MNLSASRRTWEEASSPAAVRLARKYEQAWRDSELVGRQPDLREFLDHAGAAVDGPGARLAILRADMTLRWDAGEKVEAQWYLNRYHDLGEDTIVALVYEEFCLREEDHESPDRADFLYRYSQVSTALERVLEIHELVGSATAPTTHSFSSSTGGTVAADRTFPEAGQTIADFVLVEELGRGAFARVFLAKERELADRPVALKVSRRGSREPQTLARLQHTHIVPVHSHRIDAASGLHLLCMPYFGRITLSRVLADPQVQNGVSGVALAEALDRLDAASDLPGGSSAGRLELSRRSYSRAIAWWCARLAEALAHAHDRGVLHRDIKPSNVLVTSDGMPMLLDFNLAREPLPDDGTAVDTATLGGTIDYMAPEHLKALGEPSAHTVDGRADIYGLGVMLYEAVTGERPFRSPRRGSSVVDALLRAIDDRLAPLPRLRDQHPEVPTALEAVIRRCLEPEPANRYQSAALLAADLQAVADDLPLQSAREPWSSRATGWVRRRRRRLAMAAGILFAMTICAAALLSILNQRSKNYERVLDAFQKATIADEKGDYRTAQTYYDQCIEEADRYSQNAWGYLTELNNVRELGDLLNDKLKIFDSPKNLDELKTRARAKSALADRTDKTRRDADELFKTADGLRFRLHLGEGGELVRAFEDLQRALVPFYVLRNEDWTKLNHTLPLLDPDRRERILTEVNELLFLWMLQIDERLDSIPDPRDMKAVMADRDAVETALKICKKALVWVEPKEPWLAMESRLKAQEARRPGLTASPGVAIAAHAVPDPGAMASEPSALACFQWGALSLREQRLDRAVDWLRRAAQLDSKNHWYRYFLADLEDKAGAVDEALKDYSIAITHRPDSPWVQFSRARLYRSKGRWDIALDDMISALTMLTGRPEAAKIQLELGYLYYELGDFPLARTQYDSVIALDPTGPYGPAARLNRANIDAESGSIEAALREYDALLLEDYNDRSARFSRAILELRQGQAERALIDCDALLEMGNKLENPHEVQTTRALALLLLGRPAEAMADATVAQRAQPSPTHERLRQRTILAARRLDLLQLDWPEEMALLPLGGRRLDADLRTAVAGLERLARTNRDETFRASLTLAVILAAQGRHDLAVAAANRALLVSPSAPRGYLIRARVCAFSGNYQKAREDIDRGLAIQHNEPGLLELRGVLRARAGDHKGALEDYNLALNYGAVDRVHLRRAASLVALGLDSAAVQEWSLALRRDPELPEAFLGRARSHINLRHWDMALADLEQAASWAHSDPRVELGIMWSYFQCLEERPDRRSRFRDLAWRAASDLWGARAVPAIRSMRAARSN